MLRSDILVVHNDKIRAWGRRQEARTRVYPLSVQRVRHLDGIRFGHSGGTVAEGVEDSPLPKVTVRAARHDGLANGIG